VAHPESLSYSVREFPVFNHEDGATRQIGDALHKIGKLFVSHRADRTLRAMIENKNETAVRLLDELFEIAILS